MSKKEASKFKLIPEENLAGEFHFGVGARIRHKFKLWEEGTTTVKYFNSIGIKHPDDMSGIIILCLHRYLNGKPLKIRERVKYYKEYWKNNS